MHINASTNAINYLKELLTAEGNSNFIRIVVYHPGTTRAQLEVSLVEKKDINWQQDIAITLEDITIYIEKKSYPCLKDSYIDYVTSELESELTIKSPNLKGRPLATNASLDEQIQYSLDNEINPHLAKHGGHVTLVKLEQDTISLKFSGGCQGCGMIKSTLKNAVEKLLFKHFPNIKNIIDVTDHAAGTAPYISKKSMAGD